MRVAFSIALLATLGLAYSVFFHDGVCGKGGCSVAKTTAVSTSGGTCTTGCCSGEVKALAVGHSEWTGTVDPAPAGQGSCCQKEGAVAISQQDGEATCAAGTCSKGESCCKAAGQVMVSVAKQDGEKCEGSCAAGGSCCQKGDAQVTVSVAKQAGEKCEGTCAAGGSCCQKGDAQVTVSVAKQDGETCEGTCSKGGSCCQEQGAQTVSVEKQDGEKAGTCEAGTCPATAGLVSTDKPDQECEAGTCCVAEAMKKLPAMTYKVGTESTCCADSAAAMAEKAKTEIKYVVAGEEFSCKTQAYTSLVEKTETFVNEFVTPKKCEASGSTSLCGSTIGCCAAAAKQTEVVVNATKDIKVGYQVGEQSACCANSAKALAEKNKASIEYVVAGQKTGCELHARLLAAQAKYAAAVKAVSTQQASTEAKTETKSEG